MRIMDPSSPIALPSRSVISSGQYQYVPKSQINGNRIGFIAPNVCECVCGLITSDQGVGFFHFSRSCKPSDLAEKLKKDFQNATSVKITLIGGNPVPGFSPWKEKNRELTYENGENKLSGPEAMEKFRKEGKPDMGCSYQDAQNLLAILDTCSKKAFEGKSLITYDYNLLNEKLAEKSFKAMDRNGQFSFKISNYKDFSGYQTLAKVIHVLTGIPELFTGNNIQHYNNLIKIYSPVNDTTANFDGDFNALPNGAFLGREGEFTTVDDDPQKIEYSWETKNIEHKSIKNKVLLGHSQ